MFLINREEILLGAPYQLSNICKIHQLTIGEVVKSKDNPDAMGMAKYNYYINLLTLEQEDILEIAKEKGTNPKNLENINIFEYLMDSAEHDENFFLELKTALSTFIKEEILISPKSKMIIVGKPKERRIIREQEFEELAMVLRFFNRMRIKQPPPENETPMQKRFRLKREMRERVKEKQQKKKADENSPDFADILSSICTMGVGINLSNIKDFTIYQIKEQLERAQLREQYYTELDMLMAGADSKKIKPVHYVRNLQKEAN